MSSCSARCNSISRLGRERPVSRKLRCRVEMLASQARSSWLSLRRWRQSRISCPTGREDTTLFIRMCPGNVLEPWYRAPFAESITCRVIDRCLPASGTVVLVARLACGFVIACHAGAPVPTQCCAHEQNAGYRRSNEDEAADQYLVPDGTARLHGEEQDRSRYRDPGAQGVAQGRRMDPLEEVSQAQQAEGTDESQQRSCHQAQCHEPLRPDGYAAWAHSITSPRSRNLAMATEPAKPNRAISRATSKYRWCPKWIPSTRSSSMPLMYKIGRASRRE